MNPIPKCLKTNHFKLIMQIVKILSFLNFTSFFIVSCQFFEIRFSISGSHVLYVDRKSVINASEILYCIEFIDEMINSSVFCMDKRPFLFPVESSDSIMRRRRSDRAIRLVFDNLLLYPLEVHLSYSNELERFRV